MITRERPVKPAHQLGCALAVRADDNAVRAHEILDRIALLEKLRIAHHIEVDFDAPSLEFGAYRRPDLVGGADRDRGLVNDRAGRADEAAQFARHVQHVAQIGRTVLIRRRTDGNKVDIGTRHRIRE